MIARGGTLAVHGTHCSNEPSNGLAVRVSGAKGRALRVSGPKGRAIRTKHAGKRNGIARGCGRLKDVAYGT